MKSHVIQLDQHDTVLSITDKLSWGKAKRVLLVYPNSGDLILRKIDLVLIQRTAEKLGLSIGLVSFSKELIKLANELKIPIFRSINDAQRLKWKKNSRNIQLFRSRPFDELRKKYIEEKQKKSDWHYGSGERIVYFSLGVFAVLFIAFLFIPSAEIQLNLREHQQAITMRVNASEKIKDINLAGSIPSQKLLVEVEGLKQTQITSSIRKPDKYATGHVRFSNLSDEMVTIPIGTIVADLNNPNLRYSTIEIGKVEPGLGNKVDLLVKALTSGTIGNLDGNSIGILIGELGIKLTVTNPEPITGGTDQMTPMATENDREDLYCSLETELRDQALKNAHNLLAEGDIIFAETVSLEETVEEVYIPAANQSGDHLSLKLKLVYSIRYAKFSDLKELAIPALNSNIPSGLIGLTDTVEIKSKGSPKTGINGIINFDIEITQRVKRKIDPVHIAQLVRGLPINRAYSKLEEELGIEITPLIVIEPSWWQFLPLVPLRIAIIN